MSIIHRRSLYTLSYWYPRYEYGTTVLDERYRSSRRFMLFYYFYPVLYCTILTSIRVVLLYCTSTICHSFAANVKKKKKKKKMETYLFVDRVVLLPWISIMNPLSFSSPWYCCVPIPTQLRRHGGAAVRAEAQRWARCR